MSGYDSYLERLQLKGTNKRERNLTGLKNSLCNATNDIMSYRLVTINDKEQYLNIDRSSSLREKKINTLPNESFALGDYVIFNEYTFLITEKDFDDLVYQYGIMEQCDYKLKWMNKDNQIVEKMVVTISASQYNSGVKNNVYTSIGYDQLIIYLPLDDDTKKIKRGNRFIIDNTDVNSIVYGVSRINSTVMAFNGVGCLMLLLTETQFNSKTDNRELKICDYVESTEVDESTDTEVEDNLVITYLGKPEIRCGGYGKTFSIETDATIDWELILTDSQLDKVKTSVSNNQCKIYTTDNKELIGTNFKLKATCNDKVAEIMINILGGV